MVQRDGTNWRTVPLGGPAGFTGRAEQSVHSATATSAGFVAVGDDANGERPVPAAWTSADGITWQRQPANDMTLSTGVSTGGTSAKAVAGGGPVVAVGGSSSVQVWSSPDGRRWTREEPPASRSPAASSAVVAAGAGAVLVSAGAGALWFRASGGTWADVAGDASVFPVADRSYVIQAMVRAGDHFVAFGQDTGRLALWRSVDGSTWERRPDPEGVFASSQVDALTVSGDLIFAAGAAPSPVPGLAPSPRCGSPTTKGKAGFRRTHLAPVGGPGGLER